MPSTTGTALTKLCCDILLADGPAACAAVEAGATTPALERVVEANNLLSGLGFESGGLALAHAVHNGITAIPTSHAFIHGEKVAFGLLTQLVLEGRPQADHCCHSAKVRGNRALPSMPIPPEAEALAPILIVVALPEELDHPDVLHTGLGKLNAAYALTRELQRRRPKLVVNYGTAGGLNPSLAGLVEIRRVLQVDMEAEPLAPPRPDPLLPGPLPARLRRRGRGVRQRRPLRDGGGSLAGATRRGGGGHGTVRDRLRLPAGGDPLALVQVHLRPRRPGLRDELAVACAGGAGLIPAAAWGVGEGVQLNRDFAGPVSRSC